MALWASSLAVLSRIRLLILSVISQVISRGPPACPKHQIPTEKQRTGCHSTMAVLIPSTPKGRSGFGSAYQCGKGAVFPDKAVVKKHQFDPDIPQSESPRPRHHSPPIPSVHIRSLVDKPWDESRLLGQRQRPEFLRLSSSTIARLECWPWHILPKERHQTYRFT